MFSIILASSLWLTIPSNELNTRNPQGGLVDFYDGGDHLWPFSQTPKYVD